jgi:hypothetical protein
MTLQPLSTEVENFIEQEITSGRYASREELVEQALILLIQQTPHKRLNAFPLAGTVLQYDHPFEPAVDPNEWEAMA